MHEILLLSTLLHKQLLKRSYILGTAQIASIEKSFSWRVIQMKRKNYYRGCKNDLLRVQTILHQQHLAAEGRLRAAQVACLLDRPLTDSSVNEPTGEDRRSFDAPSCDTQKGLPEDGHSYAGTIVRGGIGDSRHDE